MYEDARSESDRLHRFPSRPLRADARPTRGMWPAAALAPHGCPIEVLLTTFRALGVLPATVEALAADGITDPFPIQSSTIPVALAGSDVIGQAKTGTGKTLGFAVPIVQRVIAPADPDAAELVKPGAPQALVVVPTRELCVQVTGDVRAAGRLRGVRVLAVYGGRAYEPQVEALREGVEVVVGTPGRLLDLAQQRILDLSHVKVLVLDEADEMLDLGFLPDVERILALTPENRQSMLFSATMPGQVISLARRYLRQPTHIRAGEPDDEGATVAGVRQFVYRAHALDKAEMVARILQAEGRGLTMIFCRTKRTAASLAEDLEGRGFAAAAVHGDLGQGAREQALRAFRNGKIDVLVATDVAARGLDVPDITHVVNYQCPEDEKIYLHRIGRTGRAGASGVAVTFVDWDEASRWAMIDTALSLGLPEPAETYSTSESLYVDLGIPRDVSGLLPSRDRLRPGLSAEQVEDLGETGRGRGQQPMRDQGAGRGRRRVASTSRSNRPAGAGNGATADATTVSPPRSDRTRRRTRSGVALAASSPDSSGDSTGGPGTESRPGADRPDASPNGSSPNGPASNVSSPAGSSPAGSSPAGSTPAGSGSSPAGSPTGSPATGAPRSRSRVRRRKAAAVAPAEVAGSVAAGESQPGPSTI